MSIVNELPMFNRENIPDVMLPKDVQKLLKISRSTTYKLLQSGELRSVRIGRVRRIPKKYLIEFIENHA